jgi:hypothetical protein
MTSQAEEAQPPRVYGPAVQLTSPWTNESQTKATQIMVDAGNGPCCHARVLCASVMRSHSRAEVPFRKQNKPEASNRHIKDQPGYKTLKNP